MRRRQGLSLADDGDPSCRDWRSVGKYGREGELFRREIEAACEPDQFAGRAPRSTWIRVAAYGLTIVGVAAAGALREALGPYFGHRGTFLFFWPVIVGAAGFGGVGPGVAGTVLSLLAVPLVLGFRSEADGIDAIGFALSAGAVVAMASGQASWRRHALSSAAAARRSEERVRRIARELALLIDCADNYALFLLDRSGCVTHWNKGAQRLTGWNGAQVLHRSWSRFFSAEEQAGGKPAADLEQAARTGRLEEVRLVPRADGSTFLASIMTVALRDGGEKPVGFGQVLRDITAERAGEHALQAREAQLRSILATVPHAMAIIDSEGRITSFNQAAEQMFGRSEAEAVGRNVSILMPSPDRERHDGYLRHYFRTGDTRMIGDTRRVMALAHDGEVFPIELSVDAAIAGDTVVFTGFMRDLRPIEAAQARLQELQLELFHASRLSAMGTMGSTIAHEINQPLAAVVNYVETSRDKLSRLRTTMPELASAAEALEHAAAEAMRAGEIVGGMRDFIAHGENGRLVEDLRAVISDSVLLSLIGAREHQIRLTLDVEEPGRCLVIANRVQVQQVLINLIRNAVEAMEDGGELLIAVRCDERFAIVRVADSGPGLSADLQANLFRNFVSTKSRGVGLGLSICRTIVEAHGGRISAGNRPEGGAEFQFTLPRAGDEGKLEQ